MYLVQALSVAKNKDNTAVVVSGYCGELRTCWLSSASPGGRAVSTLTRGELDGVYAVNSLTSLRQCTNRRLIYGDCAFCGCCGVSDCSSGRNRCAYGQLYRGRSHLHEPDLRCCRTEDILLANATAGVSDCAFDRSLKHRETSPSGLELDSAT